MTPGRYVRNVLKLVDVAVNVVLLFSERVETLSRRAGLARNANKRWGCVFCALVNPLARALFGQPDHCQAAVDAGPVE